MKLIYWFCGFVILDLDSLHQPVIQIEHKQHFTNIICFYSQMERWGCSCLAGSITKKKTSFSWGYAVNTGRVFPTVATVILRGSKALQEIPKYGLI
jgi:hypothetical protein